MAGIKPTTYRRHKGVLFRQLKRLENNYRVFTKEDVERLRKIWSGIDLSPKNQAISKLNPSW
jgi:DNA-binding transcriptional MerR regulator